MNSLTIFLTGVTGVLGKRVSTLLIEQGHRVVALCRSHENLTYCKQNGIIGRMGDLFDKSEVVKLSHDCDVIMHLATHMPKRELPAKKDWKINDMIRVEGTANLIQAAIANRVKLYIQPSVAFVYGDQGGNVVTEQSMISEHQISMTKSAVTMESIVREKLNDIVPYIILRFGMFYSHDSFHTLNLVQNIKNQKMPIIGTGEYYWNFLHVDDAASAIIYAMNNAQQLRNKTLNVADYNPILFKDFAIALSNYFMAKAPRRIPFWLARLLLGNDVYKFITNSYQLRKSSTLAGWTLKNTNIIQWIIDTFDPQGVRRAV